MMQHQFEGIESNSSSGVLTLWLDRGAKRNALTKDMVDGIVTTVRAANEDRSVRVIVLRGRGRSFCSGEDIHDVGIVADTDSISRYMERGYFPAVRALRTARKPVIAAVHGHALGAGLELAMACDIRVVAESAELGIPLAKLGLAGGTYLLPQLVGLTRAVELLFTGRHVSGAEAAAIGLATECAPDGEFEHAAASWADALATAPTIALGLMKRAVYRCFELGLDDGHEMTAVNSGIARATVDAAEGRKAWIERRPPGFIGR